MICSNTKELLCEIKRTMDLHDIPMKELAARMNKSQQAISQTFVNGNPTCNKLYEICDALGFQMDVTFIKEKDGTE